MCCKIVGCVKVISASCSPSLQLCCCCCFPVFDFCFLSLALSLSPLALLHFNISTTHTCTPLYYLSSGSGSKVVLPVKEKESVCVLVCQICLDFLVFCCRCRCCRCTRVSACPVLDGLTTCTLPLFLLFFYHHNFPSFFFTVSLEWSRFLGTAAAPLRRWRGCCCLAAVMHTFIHSLIYYTVF